MPNLSDVLAHLDRQPGDPASGAWISPSDVKAALTDLAAMLQGGQGPTGEGYTVSTLAPDRFPWGSAGNPTPSGGHFYIDVSPPGPAAYIYVDTGSGLRWLPFATANPPTYFSDTVGGTPATSPWLPAAAEIVPGTLFVDAKGSGNIWVWAWDHNTSTFAWQRTNPFGQPPTQTHSAGDALVIHDPVSGALRWQSMREMPDTGAATAGDVLSINPNGNAEWSTPAPGGGAPLPNSRLVPVGGANGEFLRVPAAGGDPDFEAVDHVDDLGVYLFGGAPVPVWQNQAFAAGAFVLHGAAGARRLYRADSAVSTGDIAPGLPSSKWSAVRLHSQSEISAGVVPPDERVPAGGTAGQVLTTTAPNTVSWQNLPTSDTIFSGMVPVGQSTFPAGHPVQGDIYRDTTTRELWGHNGTSWVPLVEKQQAPAFVPVAAGQQPPALTDAVGGELAIRPDGNVWWYDSAVPGWRSVVRPTVVTQVTVTGQDPATNPPAGNPAAGDVFSNDADDKVWMHDGTVWRLIVG